MQKSQILARTVTFWVEKALTHCGARGGGVVVAVKRRKQFFGFKRTVEVRVGHRQTYCISKADVLHFGRASGWRQARATATHLYIFLYCLCAFGQGRRAGSIRLQVKVCVCVRERE